MNILTLKTRDAIVSPGGRCCLPVAWLSLLLLMGSGCGGLTASSYNAEGVTLFQQTRYEDALRKFQAASYAEPSNADAYYNLAASYHQLGKTQNNPNDLGQAETYYNLCLDRDPNHAACYRGLAVLLAEEGRSPEAFRLLQGWVSSRPDAADARIELARLYDELGDRNTAKDNLIEALALDPNSSRALAALGKIREETGDPAQALANYQRSLWYETNQPQLASRVSALRSNLAPVDSSINGGASDTRLVERNGNPIQ